MSEVSIELISDFNIELLGRYLTNLPVQPACTVKIVPFGQVIRNISARLVPSTRGDGAVIWSRPEGVIEGIARAAAFEPIDHESVMAEVAAYADLVEAFARDRRFVAVASWALAPWTRGYGVLEFRPGVGLAHLLARANLLLAERWARCSNIYLLDSNRWLHAAAAHQYPTKLWYAAKIPYPMAVFEDAALEIKALLRGISGKARKLVVLDLDDTLWGGTVGEIGWSDIRLGGHDHVGEAFVAFQRALKGLTRRGIQLAIASKNDEAVALAALDHHPEMQLHRSDFAGWRIDWNDKAANIAMLVADLNLGLQSTVFIDNDAAERARVREALPDVLVPEWPSDPTAYVPFLEGLRCFDASTISAEDRNRTAMYVGDRERRASQATVGSLDDWLRNLGVRVTSARLGHADLPRAAQLFNKTNQFNLSTRRLTEQELRDWAASPDRFVWTVRVSDRFGDLGLTGIVALAIDDDATQLTDLVMSCRVIGRGVEETMLHLAVRTAIDKGAGSVVARFVPTERNDPMLKFLDRSGFRREGEIFRWSCSRAYPLPSAVTLIHQSTPIE